MKKIIFIIMFVFLQADNLKIMTEIFPPYQYKENGKLVGISVDIVKSIQKKIDNHSKINVYSWIRANEILDKFKNTMLFSMMRIPERENKYIWLGPIDKIDIVFFKRKDSNISLNSLEDAKKVHKIGVIRRFASCEFLLDKNFKNLDIIYGHDDQNIKKLLRGRIDLWPSSKKPTLYELKQKHLLDKIVPIKNVVLIRGYLYIAFNKNTDKKIINKWKKAFEELKKEGIIEKIKQKYRL